jgi:non-heme Fe2+,alpha-ketoglutarate-dependent halogenase
MSTPLTRAQVDQYAREGYLLDLPRIYTTPEMDSHNARLEQLMTLLEPGETAKDIREWHETSRWLYDICMNDRILDLVEGILGPDFFLWASSFFIKEPHTSDTVGWHQDAYYWPMAPHHSVTVWLAFTDVDEGNAALQIIPGSHEAGVIKHKRTTGTHSVISLELESGTFSESTAVSLSMAAGHGSPANTSSRRRTGLTIRYSGTDVKNDLSVNPHFKTYLCRGRDQFQHNPVGVPPTQEFGRPSFKAISREEAGLD